MGHDSIIAAGSLLPEGIDGLRGGRGKVKPKLSDEEVAGIRWYGDSYVAYRLDYMK